MNIVIDCGWGGPDYAWGPWLCNRGLGGSEECVIYLAAALARKGQSAVVVNHCGNGGGIFWEGVRYQSPELPYPADIDLYVSWRSWERIVREEPPARQAWLWCHDIPVGDHFPQTEAERARLLEAVDKVVLLNQHHRRLYAAVPDEQVLVCPIGLVPGHFDVPEAVERFPGRVIFASHPHRGLHRLREVWPQVREAVPHATLAAFWWQPECFHDPVPELGILPMRSCGHAELAREMRAAEVLGYPCTGFPEISPATCIKAQAAGAVPVFVPSGGIEDVTRFGFACTQESFAGALIEALKRPEVLAGIRRRMQPWARETFNWDAVADRWIAQAAA